jgi:GTPase SAR1 family protein
MRLQVDNVTSFQAWSIAGQNQYRCLASMFIYSKTIAIVVYSVTDKKVHLNQKTFSFKD